MLAGCAVAKWETFTFGFGLFDVRLNLYATHTSGIRNVLMPKLNSVVPQQKRGFMYTLGRFHLKFPLVQIYQVTADSHTRCIKACVRTLMYVERSFLKRRKKRKYFIRRVATGFSN